MTDYREQLRQIRTFPSLVRFLRDELDWPVATDDFEELTFDYEPEELGIDEANAAKIDEIKRLRPLVPNQPWGIFFVKFEPKQLPVVALRRILAGVVVKKRTTASAAEHPKWGEDDLLFISNYGEGDERRISFAHFSRDPTKSDLPTLKVIAWDELDTPLHLDHTADLLVERLSWPAAADERDVETWRERWSSAFELRHREVITTSKVLAERLAELARRIRDEILRVLEIETEDGKVTRLMTSFRESLVHDLDDEAFADMYAQTIAYGLLSARIADPCGRTADDLAAHMRTNPFLRELLETFLHVGGRRGKAGGPGIDFDELGVGDVVALLDDANMQAVVRDFGDRNPLEDPVIHFYEHFLSEYDKKLKIQRGVFYTPQPIVSYIVRSVHELLQTEFGLADGLADTTTWGEMLKKHPSLALPPLTDDPHETRTISPDEPFVQILDPATGTATFLVEVIDVVHRTLATKWTQQGLTGDQQRTTWNDYVPQHLLPRLHAFELMMAPYAIAHLKVGLKLAETGYRFDTEERARIYLTNALEPWQKQLKLPDFEALAHEAAAVNEIKRHKRFTVVIGNPPYSLVSANMELAHRALVERYKFIAGEPLRERGALQLEKILNDDYVKFIAKSQDILNAAGTGLLGLITNHAYLDNPTMRGLRHSFLESFELGYFFDLGGSAKKVGDNVDGNVFDIQQGVAICVIVKSYRASRPASRHARLGGVRESKYRILGEGSVDATVWSELSPSPPYYLFVPTDYGLRSDYEKFVPLSEIFPLHSIGCFTSKDHFVISRDPQHLVANATAFRDSQLPDEELCMSFKINPKDAWDVRRSREQLKSLGDGDIAKRILHFAHRPFDLKHIFFHRSLVWSMAYPVNRNLMKRGNLALVTSRQLATPPWNHVFCANAIVEMFLMSNKTKEGNHVFPLYVLPDDEEGQHSLDTKESTPNLFADFLKRLASTLELQQAKPHGLPAGLEPEDIFHYAYAVFHSPGYRSRYAGFLKIDFPRLPLTGNLELFRALALLGGELTALHLLESPRLTTTVFIGGRHPQVARVGWSDDTVWLNAGRTSAREGHRATVAGSVGFRGVPEAVWDFHIGGYQVCHKWLKDRKGLTLSDDDIAHYQKVVLAISETIRLMAEIDEVIGEHGGWPDAFATSAGGSEA